MKRFASAVMLLVLMVSVLAACGQPTTTTPSATTGAASPAASSAASPAASSAASPAASPAASTAASPSTSETTTAAVDLPSVEGLNLGKIKIASQSPLSGPQAQFGGNAKNGAELAVSQLSEQIGFTDLEFVPFDDQAQEPVGASNANTIAADQDILCVVGHVNSGVALAALPTYKSANLTMITPANTSPRVTEEFTGTAYRLVGRDDVQGVVAADFASKTLGAKTVYVLHDQTAYGEGLATVFRDQAEKNGLTVAGFAGTQETAVFDAVLTPVLAANPDLVFFGGIYDRAGPLLQQMRARGIESKFLGGDGLDSSDLARLGGEGVVGANYVTVAGSPSSYPQAAQFITDYQAKYNVPGAYPALQAYDGARACMVAIANAAIKANGKPTRQQVNEAFKELGAFQGVTGDIKFNEKGDRDPATYYVFEVKSGDPAKWAENEVVDAIESRPPQQ